MKRGALIAALLILAALAVAAGAGATRTVRIPSKVSIANHHGLHFVGRVTSSNHACVEQRKVVLYRVIENGPDQALGHDVTGSDGSWSVEVSGFAGISLSHFYAKVKRRSEGTAGTIYVCQGDRSRTIKLSG
ncbi:MAG: hypothetical protein ACTHN3_03815 [Solirubrobacterales bacterium]